MAHDVFVSYSHKDKTVADAIVSYLEFKGSRCWYAPRDIAPGADWAASINEAIKASKIMVLLFTDFANASVQVAREVNLAVSNGVTIIPFKMTEAVPTEGMQYYLSTVHWLDALSTPLDQSIKHLDAQVRGILTGAPASKPQVSVPTTVIIEKKRPAWMVPAIAALAVLAIAGAVLFPRLLGGGGGDTAPQDAGDSPDGGSAPLEAIAVPTNGSAQIADPDNTGTQGNLQGNYQNGGLAATDGEWFYYRSNDNMSLYRMRLDGSEKTKLNDRQSGNIGVYDGYVYYYTGGKSSGIWRMKCDGSQDTNIYIGSIEDMCIVDGRIYFKNSLDGLKLYSMALDGTDIRCEGDLTQLYYLTFWDGRMYWSNDDDGGCLYRANYDGSEMTKLTENAVDSVTVADGMIMYNNLGDYNLHLLDTETLEDYKVVFEGIYEPVISSWGIIGKSSSNSLHLCRMQLGSQAINVLTDFKVKSVSVAEGYIFFVNEETGMACMMDIYGENLIEL